MPPIKAHAEVFRNWEGLIGACERNIGRLPGVEPLLDVLKGFLAQAKDTKLEQEHQMGLRKAKTQQFNLILDGGREAERKVQSFVLTCYDSRDEQLTEFGIKVNRSRKRKPQPPKPAPEAAAPSETAVTAPASAEGTANATTPAPTAEQAEKGE